MKINNNIKRLERRGINMKCSKCGTEFDGNFCPSCGTKAEKGGIPKIPKNDQQKEKEDLNAKDKNTTLNNNQSNSNDKKKEFKSLLDGKKDIFDKFNPRKGLGNSKLESDNKKPIYKRWWFIVIAALIILFLVRTVVNSQKNKVNWSELKLADVLPEPDSKHGEIHQNTDEELWVEFEDSTDNEFDEYVKACKEKGFTIDKETSKYTYDAFNKAGYSLKLSHYSDDKLGIELKTPMDFTEISWPTSKVGNLLPQPKSKKGNFSYEKETGFRVYISNTSKSDYEKYVKACSEKGFTVNYQKYDKSYIAENSDGYKLSLCYEGNKIMSIEIKEPENSQSSSETIENNTSNTEQNSTGGIDSDGDGLRDDFKAAMDSYEATMNEYCEFMKQYEENPSDSTLLSSYASYMKKYSECTSAFEKWESTDLNDAETSYYIEVQTRVSQKLLEVTQ